MITSSLWIKNRPQDIWRCEPPFPDELWLRAATAALPVLEIPGIDLTTSFDSLLENILGEGQFGAGHFNMSLAKRIYYRVKPFFPQPLAWVLRKWYSDPSRQKFPLQWPVEPRYALFLRETLRQVLLLSGERSMRFINFWPDGHRYALILSHDVETQIGQENIRAIADLEESLGFRSSFNFIPERYDIDRQLVGELKSRGFEIGIHGLKHDGKLFLSKQGFDERAVRINEYIKKYDAVGFRAPLTHRNPAWMQVLDIEYDSSFFDTDPYEPMPGGSMSIFPYFLGHFVELPYTLMQDYTLASFLKEDTPRLWLEKTTYIEKYNGMAFINTHPDYLRDERTRAIYTQFLEEMRTRDSAYLALPRDAARWWRARSEANPKELDLPLTTGIVHLEGEKLRFEDNCPTA